MSKRLDKTLYVSHGITAARLPSGKLDAFEEFGLPKDFPARPDFLVCDCCLRRSDRLWFWQHRGFCMGFPCAGRARTIFCAGEWGFCVFCRALFDTRAFEALTARVVTLNPDLDGNHVLRLYQVL